MSPFWDSLYPLIEEGDASYRMAPTEYLSAKAAARLKEVPLTEGFGERQPLCWVDWERALRNEKVPGGGEEILHRPFWPPPAEQFAVYGCSLPSLPMLMVQQQRLKI